MRIKLKTNGEFEKKLYDYFEEFASDMLVEKINSGKKTFTGCWNYITSEARKRAKGNCACVSDEVVYGWATHYFEEDDVKEQETGAPAKVTVSNSKPEETGDTDDKPKPGDTYIDLSDFL